MTNPQPEDIDLPDVMLLDEGEDNHDYGDLLADEVPPEDD